MIKERDKSDEETKKLQYVLLYLSISEPLTYGKREIPPSLFSLNYQKGLSTLWLDNKNSALVRWH